MKMACGLGMVNQPTTAAAVRFNNGYYYYSYSLAFLSPWEL